MSRDEELTHDQEQAASSSPLPQAQETLPEGCPCDDLCSRAVDLEASLTALAAEQERTKAEQGALGELYRGLQRTVQDAIDRAANAEAEAESLRYEVNAAEARAEAAEAEQERLTQANEDLSIMLAAAKSLAPAAEAEVERLTQENRQLNEHVATLNQWIKEAVEIAAVFQCGGELHDEAQLRLGGSTVHDGMRWLLTERASLKVEKEAAAAAVTRLQAQIEGLADAVSGLPIVDHADRFTADGQRHRRATCFKADVHELLAALLPARVQNTPKA